MDDSFAVDGPAERPSPGADSPTSPGVPLEPVPVRSAEEISNIESFRRFARTVWAEGNIDFLDQALSPHCLVHLPVGDLLGADAYRHHVESSRDAFSDFELDFEDVVAEDDRVVARWMLGMTHTGELQGTEATGRRVSLDGITIVRFREGEIFEAWDCWNMLDLLGQIGALPTFDDED